MPTYDFYCKKCDKPQEVFCKIDEREALVCQHCQGKMEQVIGNIAGCTFGNPGESSKWDNWGYRWGHNLERAKMERHNAEKAQKHRAY